MSIGASVKEEELHEIGVCVWIVIVLLLCLVDDYADLFTIVRNHQPNLCEI